jgi:hypothetical protein
MTTLDLKQKWSELTTNPVTNGFRSLRISADCICELYLGVSSESKRSLILSLPSNKILDFKGTQKENISIEYFREKNLIVLQSTHSEYNDIFDDLILSLYQGIKNLTQVDDYSKYFIHSFYRWSEFFDDKPSEILSEDIIKGIIGELLILKLLIKEPDRPEINFLLKAWTGPYDKGNDFELENKNLEVKSKTPLSNDIRISSEFQLEVMHGKGLELYVVSLISDYTVGIKLNNLVLEIKELVQESSGDNAIFWKALNQKNITAKNISLYDIYRFAPVNWIAYNCSNEKFPKLNKSCIPEEISNLEYTLNLTSLKSFIIKQGKF